MSDWFFWFFAAAGLVAGVFLLFDRIEEYRRLRNILDCHRELLRIRRENPDSEEAVVAKDLMRKAGLNGDG